ncbi:MAG: hypothetical protein EXS05_22890 [Planctomycetaceae bacterium]|nr:hypothetical protein [Planctomycetaceae bacterium]
MLESQSPESISDEILSAFLDGELPANQAAQVERWLATSPGAQRKLHDFRRLSGWLHDLPRAELPPEFASQVMQEAERRMLLPTSARPAAAALDRARRFQRRALLIAAPLTTAALLLVTMYFSRPEPERPIGDQPAPKARGDAQTSGPGTALIAEAGSAKRFLPGESGAKLDEQPGLHSRGALTADHDSDLSKQAATALPAALAGDRATADQATPDTDAQEPQFAGLMEQIRKANDEGRLLAVRIVVVDRVVDLKLLQVILDRSENPIDPATGDAQPTTGVGSDAVAPNGVSEAAVPSGQQGVFVVADAGDLARALNRLKEKDKNVSWSVEMIDVARLDGDSQRLVNGAMSSLNKPWLIAQADRSAIDRTDAAAEKSDGADSKVSGPAAPAPKSPGKGGGVEPKKKSREVAADDSKSAGILSVPSGDNGARGVKTQLSRVTVFDRRPNNDAQHDRTAIAGAIPPPAPPVDVNSQSSSARRESAKSDDEGSKLVGLIILLEPVPAGEASAENPG